ncbi:MAG: hypothetical protein KJ072_25335, partial [Verrucomicrobia bacterium]|nr:hypothetical protein [Verrucomicrobiota bacterium]
MRRQIAHLIALAFGLTVPLPVTLLAQQGIVSLNPNDGVALTTEPNTTYLIEASEDLQTWLPWQTFTATNSLPVTFPVEFESIGKAFYRAFVVYQNDWAVGRTLVDGYPLAAMSEDGLQMMILAQARTETDFHLLGTVVWNTNHVVLTVLFGPEGVPDLARLGNTTFLFRNYQANSVDVGVLFDDGTSNIVRNVSLGRASAPDPNRSIQKSGRNQHSVSQAYWDLLSSARAKTESAVMVVRMSEMIAEDPELGASALLHRLGYWLQRNLELTYSVDAFHFDVTHGFSGDLIARRRLETWIGHGAVKDLFSALAALREHLRRLDEALASGEIVGSLHPSTAYFGSLASTGSINVKALADWSSQSTEPWVEIWSGHDGSGDGTIHYNV